MIHQLKVEKKYYRDIIAGHKTFEVRKNDRNFKIGDLLGFNETVSEEVANFFQDNTAINAISEVTETGECVVAIITYILNDERFCKDGYVTLGFNLCRVTEI